MINITEIMRKYITAYFKQLRLNDMNKKKSNKYYTNYTYQINNIPIIKKLKLIIH
jgi:hypothetical protein